MRGNNFNRVAFIYDWLAKVVFGSVIRKAQNCFLETIRNGDTVLILGGGTGWIARDLLNVRPLCRIYYIEASHRMLERARTTLGSFTDRVTFIHGTEDAIPEGTVADGVITNFFLDLFTTENLSDVIGKIQLRLKPDFYWLVADFVRGTTIKHKMMLWLMYRFFRMACQIDACRLPSWQAVLKDAGLLAISERDFYDGFIRSAVYRSNE